MGLKRNKNQKMLALLALVVVIGAVLAATQLGLRPKVEKPIEEKRTPIDVRVNVDRAESQMKSALELGMSNTDTGLYTPWPGNDPEAVKNAKGLIKSSISDINVHMMAWGTDDPWPDPSQDEPGNWGTLDQKMQLVLETGARPILTLCQAPWWMKGRLNADGSTTLLSKDDDFADIAYSSRILDNKMDAWLHLVRRAAERYMAAPYNVRYFQVWNELKGYYNSGTNDWDMSTSEGDPSKANATHGYTYMYNRVYKELKQVAEENGIDPASIEVGGPYVVTDTWSSSGANGANGASTFEKAYGVYDQRSLNALKYWLSNKVGAEFITIDGSNANRDNNADAGPFTASEIFADVVGWIRRLDNRTYPGVSTLPIWWAEWYASPYTSDNKDYDNAVKTYAMIKLLKARGAVALAWGSSELWTPTSEQGGGQALPWYYTLKELNNYFGAGTTIYKTTVSADQIEAVASANKVLVVNKVSRRLVVEVEGSIIILNPYQVRIVDVPF